MELCPDAILVSNQATTVKINSPVGAQSYASYTMTEAGLMTITFKSVGTAHGNVAISIFNEDNVQLWYRVWATTEGTINYSMFVEAGEYSITLAKSDPGDMSEYYVAMTRFLPEPESSEPKTIPLRAPRS